MIFKVYYQPTKRINPRRENTETLYLEAKSEVEARLLVEENTEYNVEFIEGLDEKTLDYEKQSENFKLTEF
ncbi:MAG TPA: DNA-dependent RNA polymerase auxiliary subunit epsilon family protein [Candidatus Ligilactobacillus excrementigallinarum]|uniref:DNA-directed RNA polymerase subunit epsilon n=1 Tax=Candidatus Ligilactobacillus excrementigallinarum TaxID=2838641 RepID=A0A9D1UXG5_9LACO|nr:DNA-dependent RNA polymerase auxiliary subunit epsilon family protein [Candidatus Ligilactobacillus excrementigallinarum]